LLKLRAFLKGTVVLCTLAVAACSGLHDTTVPSVSTQPVDRVSGPKSAVTPSTLSPSSQSATVPAALPKGQTVDRLYRRKSNATLPASCFVANGITQCSIPAGTSLTLPSPITAMGGYKSCGPTVSFTPSYYTGPSPDVSVTIAPLSTGITCGATVTPNVTFTVRSAAPPTTNSYAIDMFVNGTYQVCDGSCISASTGGPRFVIVITTPCYYIQNFGRLNALIDGNPRIKQLATYLKNQGILLPAQLSSIGDTAVDIPDSTPTPSLHWNTSQNPVGNADNAEVLYHELLHEYYEYAASGGIPPFPYPSQGGPTSATASLPDSKGRQRTVTYSLNDERYDFEHLLIHNDLINAFGQDLPYGIYEALIGLDVPYIGSDTQPYSFNNTKTLATSFSYRPNPPPYPYTTACQ